MIVAVYLPKPGQLAHIAKGSGIVGRPWRRSPATDRIDLYYEGNLYDAANLRTYVERVAMAAARLAENAPTIAHYLADREQVIEIGTYGDELIEPFSLHLSQYQALLDDWLRP